MPSNLIIALERLGYRKYSATQYCKSIGYCLIRVDIPEKKIMSCFYTTHNNMTHVWQSCVIEGEELENIEREIREFEEWNLPSNGSGSPADYGFMTHEQKVRLSMS